MKTASTRDISNNTTPQYDSHMKRGPLQQIRKLKFQISPQDGTHFAITSSLQKSTTKYNKRNNNDIQKYPVTPKKKIPTTRKSQSKAIKSQNHLKQERKTDTPSLKLCMPHQAPLT